MVVISVAFVAEVFDDFVGIERQANDAAAGRDIG